jgi:hypothetical protein
MYFEEQSELQLEHALNWFSRAPLMSRMISAIAPSINVVQISDEQFLGRLQP